MPATDDDRIPDRIGVMYLGSLIEGLSDHAKYMLVAGAVGFGGMFAVYTYIVPTLTEVGGLAESVAPVFLLAFGLGMVVGMVVAMSVVMAVAVTMERDMVEARPDDDGEQEAGEGQRRNEGDQQLHRSSPTPSGRSTGRPLASAGSG